MFIRNVLFTLLVLVISFISFSAFAKTITIPGDAASIQEAVELAASGDEIVVNATEVEWSKHDANNPAFYDPLGVRIEGKNLAISGNSISGQTSIVCGSSYIFDNTNTMFFIRDSNVSLKNFYLKTPLRSRFDVRPNGGPLASPLYVESGLLKIIDCDLTCWIECHGNLRIQNSTIHGYAWLHGYGYVDLNVLDPSIHFTGQENTRLEIIDSTISSDNNDGYRNIIVENSIKSEIILKNSTFTGSVYHALPHSYPSSISGSDGFALQHCQDIRMEIDNCLFYGGKGWDAGYHRGGSYSMSGVGGNGLSINDTAVTIHFSQGLSFFYGNTGGSGGIQMRDIFTPSGSIDAANGGNGIFITNSVVAIASDISSPYELFGGKGGAGMTQDGYTAKDGVDGLPFYMDENSKWISNSPVVDWALFE